MRAVGHPGVEGAGRIGGRFHDRRPKAASVYVSLASPSAVSGGQRFCSLLMLGPVYRLVGPILLGCTSPITEESGADSSRDSQLQWRRLPPHRDEEQVQRDVDRSFIYYPQSEPPNIEVPPREPPSNIPYHRPERVRSGEPQIRIIRLDNRSSPTRPIPELCPGLSRHLPGLPSRSRSSSSSASSYSPLPFTNPRFHAPYLRRHNRAAPPHSRHS